VAGNGDITVATAIAKVRICRGPFAVSPQENGSDVSSTATAKCDGLWITAATAGQTIFSSLSLSLSSLIPLHNKQ
jgi:hypothetical protein